jgi:hypothetical protein
MAEAISLAKELKDMHALALALNWAASLGYAVSLEKRAEEPTAEYRRQKESESGGRGVRLPLC